MDNTLISPGGVPDFLAGGGEMGRLIAAMDWSKSPLGPIASWPQSLRTTVSLCLASNFPISLAWGPAHVQIYNDGYWPICGGKHPRSMGQDYKECWASAWPAIGAAFERGWRGEASYIENQPMFLDRNGYLEETFFTFSFSPIRDESGRVGGLFHPVTEQTKKNIGQRHTRVLRDLAAHAMNAKSIADVFTLAAETLAQNPLDVPFALFYALDADGANAGLAGSAGLMAGTRASPDRIVPESRDPWPIFDVVRSGHARQVNGLAGLLGPLACGPYPNPPDTALLLPISAPGSDRPLAVMIAGISSRLPLDRDYRDFFDLVAAAVTAAAFNAHAYEGERQRAEKLAELDRAKTTFFSNVSHEFRTPLTLMLGPIEDALADASTGLPPAQRERLDVARRNALRLLRLVNTLLDFSRLEVGRARTRFVPTDLAALTVELASNFQSVCERAGLALILDCPPLAEPVHVDREMWEKIVTNLISNAFKFTLHGEIAVGLKPVADGRVELAVRDTGVGIAATALPHVFDRFHRIEGSQGRSVEGSGIGLALVQEMIKLHGGAIAVESEVGRGTIFRATLPFGTAHLPAENVHAEATTGAGVTWADAFVEEALRWLPDPPTQQPAPAPAPGDTVARVAPMPRPVAPRIVLADDNADMRTYLRRLLEAAGYRVDAVADGTAALAACLAAPPDLLLTDVMMPGLDGFALLRRLRDSASGVTVPVIMLSARSGEEARVEGLNAGADDYIVKPFSGRELLARVESVISLFQVRRMASAREHELLTEIAKAQADVALFKSESHLRVALEAGRLGSWELDLASDASKRAPLHDRIFGYDQPVAKWGFQDFSRHLLDEERERVEQAFRESIASNTDWDVECRIRRPDGQVRWIALFGRPVRDENGVVTHMFGLVSDITDRKNTEVALRHAQKMEAVGRLTAGVAHDFNNLLQALSGSLELLLEVVADHPDASEWGGIALRAAVRGKELTSRLLSFSRKQILMPRPISVSVLFNEVHGLITHLFATDTKRTHELVMVPGPPGMTVVADQAQLEAALINVAVNARDAMVSGGRLRISAYEAAGDATIGISGPFTVISVADTGTGMDAETLAQACEPFFSTKGLAGTGLGLSMVQGFARQSGGEMTISSVLGEGTTIELWLPSAPAPAEVAAPAPAAPISGAGHILLVDDSSDGLLVVSKFLRLAGFEVTAESSAEHALARLTLGTRYSGIITDFFMPGMNGAQLLTAARKIDPSMPAMIITGFADPTLIPEAKDITILRKPFDRAEFLQAVRKLIEPRVLQPVH